MDLRTYLEKNRISPLDFASYCGIGIATVYRIMKGQKTIMRTALIIEKATNGAVTYEEVINNERIKRK